MKLKTDDKQIKVSRYRKNIYQKFFAELTFEDDQGNFKALERRLRLHYDVETRNDLTKEVLQEVLEDMVEHLEEEYDDIEISKFSVEERQPAITHDITKEKGEINE